MIFKAFYLQECIEQVSFHKGRLILRKCSDLT